MLKSCFKIFRFSSINHTVHCSFKTVITVNEYLKDRSVPASKILESLTPEDVSRLSDIKREHEIRLSCNDLVPEKLSENDLVELLCLSNNQRRKYLKFRFKIEMTKYSRLAKQKEREDKPEQEQEQPLQERNNMLVISRYYQKDERDAHRFRMFSGVQMANQEVVFDLSFESSMSRHECKNLASQLFLCYSLLLHMPDPMQLVLCGLKSSSALHADLVNYFVPHNKPDMEMENLPLHTSKQSYQELYPNRRLIYLSPDSSQILEQGEFDHEAIYILGGIVDRGDQLPLTLAKARAEGIEHRSFPIDRAVRWVQGQKSLTLNQSLEVLGSARASDGDWISAIQQAVPRANIATDEALLLPPTVPKSRYRGRARSALFGQQHDNNHSHAASLLRDQGPGRVVN